MGNSKCRICIHPGEMLLEEFLKPMNISQTAFAKKCKLSPSTIFAIVRGKRKITNKTAKAFAKTLKTSYEFWINLQNSYNTTSNNIKTT